MQLHKTRWLILDTETTGFDPEKDRVVQVGAVWMDAQGNITDTFESLVTPGDVKIPAAASAVHHLVDEDVADAPELKEVLAAMEARKTPYDALAAHNAPFDMAFLKPPSSVPVWDTLRVARKLWPELEQHKNQFLRYHFRLKVPQAQGQMAHSALPDALVTAAVLRHQLETLFQLAVQRGKDPMDMQMHEILEWAAKPIFMGPLPIKFGKHKGRTWEEVARTDRSYLEWMTGPKGMSDLDPDQKFTIDRLLGRIQ